MYGWNGDNAVQSFRKKNRSDLSSVNTLIHSSVFYSLYSEQSTQFTPPAAVLIWGSTVILHCCSFFQTACKSGSLNCSRALKEANKKNNKTINNA